MLLLLLLRRWHGLAAALLGLPATELLLIMHSLVRRQRRVHHCMPAVAPCGILRPEHVAVLHRRCCCTALLPRPLLLLFAWRRILNPLPLPVRQLLILLRRLLLMLPGVVLAVAGRLLISPPADAHTAAHAIAVRRWCTKPCVAVLPPKSIADCIAGRACRLRGSVLHAVLPIIVLLRLLPRCQLLAGGCSAEAIAPRQGVGWGGCRCWVAGARGPHVKGGVVPARRLPRRGRRLLLAVLGLLRLLVLLMQWRRWLRPAVRLLLLHSAVPPAVPLCHLRRNYGPIGII